MAYDRLLPPGVYFFFQFATQFLFAVRLGRQALWLVLVVCWLFCATSQCA